MTQRYAKPPSQQRRGLEAAVSTYGLAFQLFDRMRTSYKAEGSKLVLAEFTTNMCGDAITAARQLNRVTRENAPKEVAFQWAEKSKSGILLDALAEAAAKRYAGIPDSLLEKERKLSLDLAFYDRVLAEEQLKRQAADSSKIALWQDKTFALKKAYEALLQRFEKEHAAYYDLKYQANTVSLQEVQQQILDDDTALLEYFTGADSLFIFVITPAAFEVTAVAKDSLFDKHVEQLRQRLIAQDVVGYSQPAQRLYQILLEPVAELIRGKNLIIVPDGVLCGVPFEALLTRQVEAKSNLQDHASLPYLINDHAISYAYSATLLAQTLKRQRTGMPRDYLAFAPVFAEGLPAGTRGADFFKENFAHDSSQTTATRVRGYLPASKREVTGVLDRFKGRYGFIDRWFGNKSHIYLQREAREENLKSPALRDYRYVHFATHGLVNEKNPKLSGLLLAQEDTTSKEDGILHLGEIYNLNLNADLVVGAVYFGGKVMMMS